MIKVRSDIDGPTLTFNATVSGLAIYLDNFSLIRLAKGDQSRRRRFIEALHLGGDLLFSVTNAADLAGPQGQSLNLVREFLDEMGPRWFPVELDPREVVNRELAGARPAQSCISAQFMKDYFVNRVSTFDQEAGHIIDLSGEFFRLGPVLDWVGQQRDSIRKGAANMDAALINKISEHRAEFERSPAWLDEHFPALPFNPSKPATFAYVNLIRNLITGAKAQRIKRGDGLDFCHAVIGAAFASVATLDKHWKRRVDNLPKPNGLAPIYYEPELDRMVTDIEGWLRQSIIRNNPNNS